MLISLLSEQFNSTHNLQTLLKFSRHESEEIPETSEGKKINLGLVLDYFSKIVQLAFLDDMLGEGRGWFKVE